VATRWALDQRCYTSGTVTTIGNRSRPSKPHRNKESKRTQLTNMVCTLASVSGRLISKSEQVYGEGLNEVGVQW